MKTILVTGATGFLGRRLVEQLKAADPEARLRLLCRAPSPFDQDPAVSVARGDVTSPDDVSRAMEGCQQVYHLAGAVTREPKEPGWLYRLHVEGTRHVCEAALRHGPQKIVAVSSSGTIAVSRAPVVHDENAGYKHEIVGEWPYYLSKIFAEKLAISYADSRRLPIVVVNPSLLLGPGDDRGVSTGDIELFLQGQILATPSGGLSFVDVRDAAAGLIAAMRSGKPGQRYLLAGPNWTFRRLIETLAEIAGVRAPSRQLPLGASLWGARLLRRLYPLAGKTYRLDEVSIKMSSLFWYCSSEKARGELGFETRDPVDTLRVTVQEARARLSRGTRPS